MMLAVAASCVAFSATSAQVAVPGFSLPPSNQLSPEAVAILKRMDAAAAPADIAGNIPKQRAFYQRFNDDRLGEMQRRFKTIVHHETIGGVGVDVVEPAEGISPANRGRVLINAHGGAFLWGAGSGALVEAIPIAAVMRVRVVTIDYRLAPDHHFPAASQDMSSVYRVLLKTYRAEAIGLYGCSAGGALVAQTTASLQGEGLPRPGAIGTFCSTGAPYTGDSLLLSGPLTGAAPVTTPPVSPYLTGVPLTDARAYALLSDDATRAMPPTLLLAGSRDFAASALTLAHRRLAAAGVPSELYLFDGLPHAFFMWPDMPESMEAFRLIAGFFDRHLAAGDKK
ncbi:alpha/beta hydrolase [Sphingomonas immobilis]|uniref:Alpha/beta hydrolase fold domain-containing protein n=1 Tax=Sphingomonas immobilis TaxID=3063997 RepID=A0ABT8ZYH3_9SPHN|nr:alpha/beta hydrolase fold domain-containing protein [Sphingomonas sp. CA1-15]MDO7841821.1 alpha/beta hydrolase fold domain-containing protein [Sphingomonas sp. CA1-15]